MRGHRGVALPIKAALSYISFLQDIIEEEDTFEVNADPSITAAATTTPTALMRICKSKTMSSVQQSLTEAQEQEDSDSKSCKSF